MSKLYTSDHVNRNSNYTVSVSILSQVLGYLADHGIDTSKVWKILEIDPTILNNPDGRIPVEKYAFLEEIAAELLNDPCIGLHMGQHTQAGNWTILGYMMMNCHNVMEAFQKFTRYSDVIGNLIACEINSCQDRIKLRLIEPKDAPKISEHCYEGYFSSLMNLARSITGITISPLEVGLISLKTDYLDEYKAVFGENTCFNRKENYMLFDKVSIETPAKIPNQSLLYYFESYAQEFLKDIINQDSYTYKTKKLILSNMDSEALNIKYVAKELHISDRTLQANLKLEGTEFRILLRDTRIQLAKKYLDDNYSVEEITYLLGFSDTSVFRKAFKNWLGITPGEYKKLQEG